MARAFMKNFQNAQWLKKIIKSIIKLHLSLMAAAILTTLESKTFQSLCVKSKKIIRYANHITQVKVATVKSACKKSWAHSETLETDQAQSQATIHHTKITVEMKVVDGRSIQWR
jgi:hypothetical protein